MLLFSLSLQMISKALKEKTVLPILREIAKYLMSGKWKLWLIVIKILLVMDLEYISVIVLLVVYCEYI